jgi:site-specific recombinase XerD
MNGDRFGDWPNLYPSSSMLIDFLVNSVWSREDAKTLLESIPKDSVSGLRDLALIAAMFYSFARVSAVLKLKVNDYYHNGARPRLRLHEKVARSTKCQCIIS